MAFGGIAALVIRCVMLDSRSSHETRRWRETDSNSLSPGTMSSAHLGARATPTKAAGAKPRMASLASRARGE
jgi:hypothetical protein